MSPGRRNHPLGTKTSKQADHVSDMESEIHFWVTTDNKKKSHSDILSLIPSPKEVMGKSAPY